MGDVHSQHPRVVGSMHGFSC